MKKQTLIILIIVVIIIFITFYLLGKDNIPSNSSKGNYLTLIIDFGSGQKRQFQTPTPEEKRAWGLLQQASFLANLILEPTNDFRPKKINGLENGFGDKKWNFYVNDVKKEESPFNVKVSPPDTVLFRFE